MWQPAMVLLAALQSLQWLQSATADDFRLPGSVQPSHYDLRLFYDLDPANNFPFFGVVDILLSASEATTKIILHGSREFTISGDENGIVLSGPPSSSKVISAMFDDKYGFLTLQLDREMEQNVDHTLRIKFYGNAKRGMSGAYINSYFDSKSGTEEYMISTQFEPDSARKVFPCFDEPAYKATFNITIGHQKGFTAISNMPLLNSHKANELMRHWSFEIIQEKVRKDKSMFTWSEFHKSVVMSTYLVAFVISKLAHVDSPPGHSTTQFRVWARRDVIHQTSYAAEIGPRLLTYFEDFFGIPYSLPKVDMVAIPGDYSSGGMENWGLITYKEILLLNDDLNPLVSHKKNTASIVSHEIAHFWFGNLVTMKWWSELWLKEGFADFIMSVAVDEVEPSWNTKITFFLIKSMQTKKQDALESSHPMTMPIEDHSHIKEMFDPITYSKGLIVLRMMSMFLGDAFRRGVQNYLAKYSYKSTDRDDLWREMTAASRALGQSLNVSVKQVMDSWITQTGYPLLTVTRDYNDSSLSVSQRRFLSRSGDSGSSTWWVPLRVLCEPDVDNPREGIMFLADDEGTTTPHHFAHNSDPNQWVIFNYDMIAFCRVNYDDRNWKLLSDTLNSVRYTDVPMLGRVQLLTDALALARTNHLDYSTALQLVIYLRHEKDQLALKNGLDNLLEIGDILKRSPHHDVFDKFIAWLIRDTNYVADIFKDNPKKGSSEENEVEDWICDALPDCQKKAIQLFRQWMMTKDPDKENPIREALYGKVYQIAIMRGKEKHWRFLFDRLQNTKNDVFHRSKIIEALTQTPESSLLDEYLETLVVEGSQFSGTEFESVLTSMLMSKYGYQTAKDFLYKRYDDINKRIALGALDNIVKLYSRLARQFTTQQEIDEFLKWREKHDLPEGSLVLRPALDTAADNVEWVARHQRTVVDNLYELISKEERNKEKLRILGGGVDARAPAALITCTATIISRLYSFCL